mmetsp:Transcript_33878/g.75132  ORF Transcript_33878/g.75132 Transcript_33878/m.75132 type:complete len:156 (+) Transcript_33878:1372-1839(+)
MTIQMRNEYRCCCSVSVTRTDTQITAAPLLSPTGTDLPDWSVLAQMCAALAEAAGKLLGHDHSGSMGLAVEVLVLLAQLTHPPRCLAGPCMGRGQDPPPHAVLSAVQHLVYCVPQLFGTPGQEGLDGEQEPEQGIRQRLVCLSADQLREQQEGHA